MGKYWDPIEKEKRGVHLTPQMRADGTTLHMDNNYQAVYRSRHNPPHFDRRIKDDSEAFLINTPRGFWPLAAEHPFGNPRAAMVEGIWASLTSLDYAYVVSVLSKWLPAEGTLLEIGGGFGGLARTLLEYRQYLDITIVDLPPMSRIQRYYLDHTGNTDSVRFVADVLCGETFDIVVAEHVFCELSIAELEHYFRIIDVSLAAGGIFYCVHHLECINNYKDWPLPGWNMIVDRQFPFQAFKNWREKVWIKK